MDKCDEGTICSSEEALFFRKGIRKVMIPLDKSKRMVEVETNATNKDEPLRSHPNMEHLDIMTRDENPNLNE